MSSIEAASNALTRGALEAIFSDAEQAKTQFPVPVMQVLQIKQMGAAAQGGADRYRLVISDGEHYVQSMLATQANHVFHEGKLVTGCIVRLQQYTPNNLKGKNIVVIIGLEVIESLGNHEKIGTPTVVERKEQNDTSINGGEFYGAKKEEEQKPQIHSVPSRAANPNVGNIYPIEGLSLFSQKWTIKARVSLKSDIKTWHKSTGEGKLFSVNLLDESGEIKATGFNDEVDAFYDLLQEGSVYYISTPAKVAFAKKQFSNLSNDYEITFNRDTKIEKAEDQASVPQVRFNFCTIQELQAVEKDNTVDVIGVLKEAGEVSEIISKKNGTPFQKRELTVVDDTGYSVRVTVWGKTANSFDAAPESVLAFKGTKVSDFGGKSLSLLSSGTMTVDPDIPDAHRLKGWYDSAGRNDTFSTHQNLASMGQATGRADDTKTIAQVKEENLGIDDKAYYTIKATIVYTAQERFCYAACPNANCNNKKVTDIGDGTWQCENCNVAHEKPLYRYILSISVADHTGNQRLTCFDETARTLVGISADELMELKENDPNRFAATFDGVNCKKLRFRCKARMENFGETPTIRYQVMNAYPLNYQSEGEKLAELIKQYEMNG